MNQTLLEIFVFEIYCSRTRTCMMFICGWFSGEHLTRVSENKDIPTELLGSWTTSIGPVQDQASEYSNTIIHVR